MKRVAVVMSLLAMVLFAAGPALAVAPDLEIDAPKEGATVKGGLVVVQYHVKDFKIVDFTKDSTVSEGQGHIHIQLDDNPYNTIHTISNVWVFAGVKPGPHTLKLSLVHSNHTPLKNPVEKTIHFTTAVN